MRRSNKNSYLLRLMGIATVVSFFFVIFGATLIRLSITNPAVQATTYPNTSSIVTPNSQSISPKLPSVSITTNSQAITVDRLSQINNQQRLSNQVAYGHLSYAQADASQMMVVGSYATGTEQRFESLNREADKAFMQMIYAARETGVWIIPVSGFRTIEQQQKLFDNQIKRLGSVEKASKISAPPGYSEHHTGYAIDLTDGKLPKQDITLAFEKTEAYRWLTVHARQFGFEMSFPANNAQGVSFEPWHWRYIGSANAAEVFANARNR
ncbi:MAG: M15 family metallopeptidase [Nostoc sp.]|uniref:M15 family metallopeptidase n=1 Tax=Nostoc sp. TaxID=1180 RepID=UPI002FF4EDAB